MKFRAWSFLLFHYDLNASAATWKFLVSALAWLADDLWSIGGRQKVTKQWGRAHVPYCLCLFWHLPLDIVGGSHWELGYNTVLRRNSEATEGNRGRASGSWTARGAVPRGQEMSRKLAFMQRYWNMKRVAPAPAWKFKLFLMLKGLIFLDQ